MPDICEDLSQAGRQVRVQEELHAATSCQLFSLSDCVAKNWLTRADPAQGRFRAYLQTLLRRHVGHVLRAERAIKRNPGRDRRVLSLREDEETHGAADEPDGADDLTTFDREWVGTAIARARARLAETNVRYALVIDDLIRTEGEGSAGLAAEVGLRPAQVPVLRHRARERFARLFEDELRATVADETAFAEEWRALAAYLP